MVWGGLFWFFLVSLYKRRQTPIDSVIGITGRRFMAKEVEDDGLDAGPAEGEADGGKKRGGPLPEFVILILKIVAGALGAILLSATVSVIVFSLMQGDKPTQQTVEASPVY